MKKILKYVVYAVIILIIGGGILSYIRAKNAPLKVKVAAARRTNIETSITSSGKIQPQKSYGLNFTSAGLVTTLPFEEGEAVKKGDIVARLQSDSAYQQTLKAEADYRLALEKIREYNFNNKDNPKSEKYVNPLFQLQASADSAKAVYDQARTTQGNLVLRSPIDGIVTQINTKAGEVSSLATPVLTVANLDTLEFVAEVDEQDAGKLQLNQAANVSLDALGDKKISGTIYDISQVAKTNSTGGTYYPTKISLEYTEATVRIGMNGDATISTAMKNDAIVIPSEAINEGDNNKYVFVAENGKAKKIIVTTGLENDTDTEITSGLTEGTEVITTEIDNLKEGMKVEKQTS